MDGYTRKVWGVALLDVRPNWLHSDTASTSGCSVSMQGTSQRRSSCRAEPRLSQVGCIPWGVTFAHSDGAEVALCFPSLLASAPQCQLANVHKGSKVA